MTRKLSIALALGLLTAGCESTSGGFDAGAGGDGGGAPAGDGAPPADSARPGDGAPASGCGPGTDPEPNDSRDQATPYTLGMPALGCIEHDKAHDFWEFTVPSDAAGGYVQVAITDVGEGGLGVKLYAASDNGQILEHFASNRGQSLNVFFVATPGGKYRVDVYHFISFSRPYTYRLQATYTRIADTFEPNDTRAAAKPVPLDMTVQGFLTAGHATADNPRVEAYDDWFSVPLTKGTVTVKLEDVPENVPPDLHLLAPSGTEIKRVYSITRGASATISMQAVEAGMHFVKVTAFSAPPAAGKTEMVPDHLRRPYKLTVTQP